MSEDKLKPLPAEKLCNRGTPNPIKGEGSLGNEKAGHMYYVGKDKKELVITLQKMLKTLGYDLGTSGPNNDGVDGKFGNKTEEAVIDFQGKNKDWDGEQLKEEGKVGPRTSDALNRAMVGEWYEHYQTPEQLVNGKPIHAATTRFLAKGLSIQPGELNEGKVFLVGLLQWTAIWDRPDEPIKMNERRIMILNAPGLTAGQEVIFEVTQEAEGKKVIISPPIVVFSHEGGAKGEFEDWYKHERVTYQINLREGIQPDTFPLVKFAFVAKAAGRQVFSAFIVYSASLETKLVRIDGEIKEPLSDVEYTLFCPWGKRIGRSDTNGTVKVKSLPPGGATIVIGGEAIISGGL